MDPKELENFPGARGFDFNEPLIFERSRVGRVGYSLPSSDVPDVDPVAVLGKTVVRHGVEGLPEVSEPEVIRHFTRLSSLNFSIDSAFYPLGSCTMKHNPRVNERTARLPGFLNAHPLAGQENLQGALELMHELAGMLAEIAGLDAATLQPAAGAQGELTGLLIMRAHHIAQGNPRKYVMIPDSAHGTNPASTTICGYEVIKIPADKRGNADLEAVRKAMSKDVAGLMLTNPNTLGLYEESIGEICEIVHAQGGLVYGDGANLNALMGKSRPGDVGIDIMHINLHKTFTTPHGGGGPGSGPVAVRKHLEQFLPVPVIGRKGSTYHLDYDRALSVGRVRSFFGNFGMFVRAYTYMRELGPDGLRAVSEGAVLNANYVRAALSDTFHLPFERTSMHEVVFTDKRLKELGVKTMDVAKRLIDYGFHPPTVYFPLVVDGALMIEPTETESRETLDSFIAALKAIEREAHADADLLTHAPHNTRFRRLDEVQAARHPVLRYQPSNARKD